MSAFKIAFLLPAYFGSNHSMFLGIGYLAAAVKKKGFKALIVDEDAINWVYSKKNPSNSLELSKSRVIDELKSYSPNAICTYINTANYKNALRMLEYVRDVFPNTYSIVGGPHISTSYSSFKKNHSALFEAAIIGEGEDSICELAMSLSKNIFNAFIPGVLYSDSNLIYNLPRVVQIDKIPFPDREAFFEIYNQTELPLAYSSYQRVFYSSLPGFEKKYARIVASRGCYNTCSFCSPSVFWRHPETKKPYRRIRSAKSVVDEIEILLSKGISAIYFDDPTFPLKTSPAFFSQFETEIKKRHLSFNWGAPICVEEADVRILDRLQDIGFTYTYFGLETYQEKDLNNFNKKQNIRQCLNLIRQCKERGIHCDAAYQIGLPHENRDGIKRSIDWIFENHIERNIFFSITAIWPETLLAREIGILSDYFEPNYDKALVNKEKGVFFYEQGNPELEYFYSNCSGTYHFIPEELAIEMKYYIFDCGLKNRFKL